MQPPSIVKNPDHKTPPSRRKIGYLTRLWRDRPDADRAAPALARFPATEPGGARPPVRIFIGTESGQARAERVLVWSILKHRDPTRDYEIYLMKRLEGFERRYWKTGFTNYRYAIPHLAGGEGRAIYNDADQIYLADPAELFDYPMEDAGVMDVDGRDTSVMLIDCARMADVWPDELARAEKAKHQEFRDLRDQQDMWRPIPMVWNARDDEYQDGQSKLLHFTTLQTQPWRPFPEEIRYSEHPDGDVWGRLEAEADRAGFTIFTADRPSVAFAATPSTAAPPAPADVRRATGLAKAAGARRLLALDPGGGGAPEIALEGCEITTFDPLAPDQPPTGPFDGAIALSGLDKVPEEDAPWLLDAMFASGAGFVFVSVRCRLLEPQWWREQMEAAARRHPGAAWTLQTRGGGRGRLFNG